MNLGNLYDRVSASEVAALPVSYHKQLADELAALEARTKRIKNVFDTAMELAYGGQNAPGTFHRKADGYDVKVTVAKRVKWDSSALCIIAESNDMASEYIDWKPSVSETRYKGAPEAVRAELDKARTVEMAKPRFEIKEV